MHRTRLWPLALALLLTGCSIGAARVDGRAGDSVDGGGTGDIAVVEGRG